MGDAAVPAVLDLARRLRAALRSFEPDAVPVAACADVVAVLAATEKACAAAKVLAAARAARGGAHRSRGFADAADWLARESGSSMGAAKAALETAAGLDHCPRTRAALATGDLSLDQAQEIAKTELVRPGSERELIDVAAHAGLSKLRDRARSRRHEAIGVDALHLRQHRARSFRHWRTDLGTIGFAGELPPEVGVPIVNRLDAECDRIRRAAKRAAGPAAGPAELEKREAYAADALVRMLSGRGRGKASAADVVLVIDLRAWRRGVALQGEPCHILGGGPIPVDVARALAGDAFVKAVIHDGVAIHTVAHLGRYKKTELRTALELGAPPGFEGVTCVEPGCDRRHGLEWDHVDPVANHGPTSYDNLKPRCWPHHREKTERDRRAGLLRRTPDETRGPP